MIYDVHWWIAGSPIALALWKAVPVATSLHTVHYTFNSSGFVWKVDRPTYRPSGLDLLIFSYRMVVIQLGDRSLSSTPCARYLDCLLLSLRRSVFF